MKLNHGITVTMESLKGKLDGLVAMKSRVYGIYDARERVSEPSESERLRVFIFGGKRVEGSGGA